MRLRVVGEQLASGGDGGELSLWRAHMQQLNGEDTHWQRSILRHAVSLPQQFRLPPYEMQGRKAPRDFMDLSLRAVCASSLQVAHG